MANLEDIPPTAYPDGSVIGSLDASGNHPESPEILHRPHAFALMHGEDGAKVAYGQFIWRRDVLALAYSLASVDGALEESHANGISGQAAIEGLNVEVPTIDTAGGAAMSAGINFNDNDKKYHQLNGYGDVYLYWRVNLDWTQDKEDADAAAEPPEVQCWVTVDGTTGQVDVPALDYPAGGYSAHNRITGAIAGVDDKANGAGTYRVKLGTVNEDAQVSQNISSDVHWSYLVLVRTAF
tara:strand:- start:343 stop:1056 length:714 start_codon:yes stop_codon:yes gene_type:complete